MNTHIDNKAPRSLDELHLRVNVVLERMGEAMDSFNTRIDATEDAIKEIGDVTEDDLESKLTKLEEMIDELREEHDEFVGKDDLPDMDDYVTKDELQGAVEEAIDDLDVTANVISAGMAEVQRIRTQMEADHQSRLAEVRNLFAAHTQMSFVNRLRWVLGL